MQFYSKRNAGERLVTIGAVVVIVSWLIGIIGGYGFGANAISLLGAIAVLVIYYLKDSPSQTINWPAPIQTIVLAISGIVALLAVLALLQVISFMAAFAGFLGLAFLALIGTAVGGVIMVWGAWQDYQAMPKTTPPSSSNNPPAA